MFFRPSATIDEGDMIWQLECWQWLLENLGGVPALRSLETRIPHSSDFPRSGKSGFDHANHVFGQVAAYFGIDPGVFELYEQEKDVDPFAGPALIVNAPVSPLGTYSTDRSGRQRISYSPANLGDLEGLIATFAHEICHPILFGIEMEPPGGADAEEFATDLAMVFYGFGIFGGNNAFRFQQFTDSATNMQGWSTRRAGYLTQNEWGFALAVRALLAGDDNDRIIKFASDGLASNFRKNLKFLKKNDSYLEKLLAVG